MVSCSVDDGQFVLSARLGKAANFVKVPLAGSNTRSISSPSISNSKIIFFAAEQGNDQSITERLYLSSNGQAPAPLISTGETLDGKIVSGLKLSDNGRAIADNSAVFAATFRDGSKALYRVDL